MKKFLAVIAVFAVAFFAIDAMAGYQMKLDGDTNATFGTKARWRWTMVNPDANNQRIDQSIPEARLYMKGQITDMVKFFFNYDFIRSGTNASATDTARGGRLTDAAIVFDIAKEAKLQAGVYRKAVSRLALQDSYQYILINGPDVAGSAYISDGNTGGFRGEGVTLWGDLADGMLRYYVGAWLDNSVGVLDTLTGVGVNPNPKDEIGLSGRLVINFMDPEKGYACPGCYLGKAQVANVGVGYLTWDYDDAGTSRTYNVIAIDAFYDAGGATVEAGYLMYDYDGADVLGTGPGSGDSPSGWYVEGAYVIDKIQPAVRYESWDADGGTDYENITVGVNYLFAGQAAKVGVEYKMRDNDTGTDVDTISVQAQIQF